jgi:hypothetical protein
MSLAAPVPATWAAAQFPQAADFNSQIRDAFTFLANRPLFRAWQSSAQSIPNGGSGTVLTSWTVLEDTYTGWSAGTSTYTVQVTGKYQITGCYYSNAGTGVGHVAQVFVVINGASISGGVFPISSTAGWGVDVYFEQYVDVGDTIKLAAFQNSGAALNTTSIGVNQASYLEIMWAGN